MGPMISIPLDAEIPPSQASQKQLRAHEVEIKWLRDSWLFSSLLSPKLSLLYLP